MSSQPNEVRRLFFALWPDDRVRGELARLGDALGRCGRAVPQENLHITLAFVGFASAATQACLEEAVGRLHCRGFTVLLDRLGYYPRPRVVWLGASGLPEPALALVQTLKTSLRGCGITPDPRPFQAHVTLRRKVARAPVFPSVLPVSWGVHDFALVESQTLPSGAQYRVLGRWSLEANGAGDPGAVT